MMTPHDYEEAVIKAWEGEYSNDPHDPGNWVNGILIGSKYGVTAQALAHYRKVPVESITLAVMMSLTRDEAADIAVEVFDHEPGFDRLVWAPATAQLLDFGWGSGPGQATISMQRLVGVTADGAIGPHTVAAYAAWLLKLGEQAAADAMLQMRLAFYQMICTQHPDLARYLQGWTNRANWARKAAT